MTQNATSRNTTPRLGKTQVTSQSMTQNKNENTEQSKDYGNDGIPSDLVTPVFNIACRLRSPDLTAETVLIASKSRLHLSIVGAITRAALRVLPIDNSTEGYLKRIERERSSAARAIENQDAFTECVAQAKIKFYTEIERRKIMDEKVDAKGRPGRGPTPDLLLHSPVLIRGHLCRWIEYKNDFGLRKSPFVTPSSKRQFKRYSDAIGPGLVVYKFGFEQGFLEIAGVKITSEVDAVEELGKFC
ncbi:hypothetical protein D6D17_10606 [Aureobasidium pullulans]|nr:hypothetical protein D6D17_10606 [Aureobasidium pullulans]